MARTKKPTKTSKKEKTRWANPMMTKSAYSDDDEIWVFLYISNIKFKTKIKPLHSIESLSTILKMEGKTVVLFGTNRLNQV